MYAYYSSLRPIGPGTFPKPEGNRIIKIKNYDTRTQTPIEDVLAWGYIVYEKPLLLTLASQYELIGPVPVPYSPLTDGDDEN